MSLDVSVCIMWFGPRAHDMYRSTLRLKWNGMARVSVGVARRGVI
jgi:hypothetical protein